MFAVAFIRFIVLFQKEMPKVVQGRKEASDREIWVAARERARRVREREEARKERYRGEDEEEDAGPIGLHGRRNFIFFW